jgi:hypothetical protein
MLYLMQGIPAAAQFLIIVCTASMSRSRSGLCPSIIAGFFSRSMWLDGRLGGVSTSTLTPLRSATSRMRVNSSTVAYRRPSAMSARLTMFLTSKRVIAFRLASVHAAVAPTFMSARVAGAARTAAGASPPPINAGPSPLPVNAAATAPVLDEEMNVRRFMMPSLTSRASSQIAYVGASSIGSKSHRTGCC